MSTSVKTADLAITIIVSLLKAAGLGPEADRILDAIEGAKDCIGLIEDIKNETVSDPNKELIRSLFKAIKEEVRSIRANLKDQGREKDEIESTVDALIETTRLTVKQLAQDDDALLDAARLPDSFSKYWYIGLNHFPTGATTQQRHCTKNSSDVYLRNLSDALITSIDSTRLRLLACCVTPSRQRCR